MSKMEKRRAWVASDTYEEEDMMNVERRKVDKCCLEPTRYDADQGIGFIGSASSEFGVATFCSSSSSTVRSTDESKKAPR